MEITKIFDCNAESCVYNKNKQCHTPAINIGDKVACCDTFMAGSQKAGFNDISGGVGSCKVDSCSFNSSLECTASGIHMSVVGNQVDCQTYRKI